MHVIVLLERSLGSSVGDSTRQEPTAMSNKAMLAAMVTLVPVAGDDWKNR
jgi:hypothetical protein